MRRKLSLIVVAVIAWRLCADEIVLHPPANSPALNLPRLVSTSVVITGVAKGGNIKVTRVQPPFAEVSITTNAGDDSKSIAIQLQNALRGKIGQGVIATDSKITLSNVSAGMLAVTCTDPGLVFPKPVTNVTGAADTSGVKLQWTKPDGVASVRIWRGDIRLASTGDQQYVDNVGAVELSKSVVYTIVSFDLSGNPGGFVTVKYPSK